MDEGSDGVTVSHNSRPMQGRLMTLEKQKHPVLALMFGHLFCLSSKATRGHTSATLKFARRLQKLWPWQNLKNIGLSLLYHSHKVIMIGTHTKTEAKETDHEFTSPRPPLLPPSAPCGVSAASVWLLCETRWTRLDSSRPVENKTRMLT